MRQRRFRSPPPPPSGFYLEYLNKLIAKRHAAGKPSPDIDSEEYWRDREKWHAENNPLPRKAA
jgi:hypothetical protein